MDEGSVLLVEELFASGDPAFLGEVRRVTAAKRLAAFAERWHKDPRPWAKAQLHAYLDLPLNRPGHEPLVKRLFKLAEAAGDDGTMARFLVAFDRSLRRDMETHWNWRTETTEDRPVTRRNSLPRLVKFVPDPVRGFYDFGGARQSPRTLEGFLATRRLFSAHTRLYLRRRAWRYFRRLGFRDPARYRAAIMEALPLYRDEDVDRGVHFLDNWGLVHALFHHSDLLWPRPHGWFVRAGRALRELRPAPAFPEAWKDVGNDLFKLLLTARARPVRRAALLMIKERPDLLAKVPYERVAEILEHPDEEVQAFGAEVLRSAAELESMPLELWLRLLELKNVAVLDAVCDVMKRAVSPGRLSTRQLLGFACGPVGPVARLGLDWLKGRQASPDEFLALARVRAAAIATDAVALAREGLEANPSFDPEWILAFLDATMREVRQAAWIWFVEEPRASRRVDLWAKLVESPYDDVRMAIVAHVERYAAKDQALRVLLARAPLETVWATVLFNIHRGNRAKRTAASQVAAAIEREPARAPQLLPLLAVAARSVRAPEFRAGLAALVRAATGRPEVAEAVARHFPELKLAL